MAPNCKTNACVPYRSECIQLSCYVVAIVIINGIRQVIGAIVVSKAAADKIAEAALCFLCGTGAHIEIDQQGCIDHYTERAVAAASIITVIICAVTEGRAHCYWNTYGHRHIILFNKIKPGGPGDAFIHSRLTPGGSSHKNVQANTMHKTLGETVCR